MISFFCHIILVRKENICSSFAFFTTHTRDRIKNYHKFLDLIESKI